MHICNLNLSPLKYFKVLNNCCSRNPPFPCLPV